MLYSSAGGGADMLVVFEVILAKGGDPEALLSEEALDDTQAQVMTIEEAKAVGFSSAQPDPKGREVRLIAVAPRDAQYVQRRLEANDGVQAFKVHEVET
jgi:hypothetical protein